MKRWLWFGIGGVIVFLGALTFILVAGQQRRRRVIAYQERLNDLTQKIIVLNMPLAELFALGKSPDNELVAETIAQMQAVQVELDALGQPPDELGQPHNTLVTAVSAYAEAFAHLADNLEASTFPFDETFRTAALHGGESVHQVTAELAVVPVNTGCDSLTKVLPKCWLWP